MSLVPDFFDPEKILNYPYDTVFYEETLIDVWSNCIVPSVTSIVYTLYKVILVNSCFSVIVSTGFLPVTVFHILSGLSGLFLLNCLETATGKIIIIIFFTNSYFLLHLGCAVKSKCTPEERKEIRYFSNSNVIKYSLVAILVLCEYFLLEAATWLEIRGVIMVFAMKLISLAEDIDKGITSFPPFTCYFGYIFCGANIMFGPWISFQEYIVMHQHPTQKNIWWIYGISRALFVSLLFLTISNCWSNYLFPDNMNRWLIGYRDALSFRTSHYFICYLSEASMLAAGYKNSKIWYEHKEWKYVITDPLKIEFPNALATVVTNWNRPMHEFLKRYIYRSWLPLGKFYGILATFVVSSFLHGFEMKVSVVLITIGIFSSLQLAARDHLAHAFNCCIKVHPCKGNCTHEYKRNSIRCRIFMLVFSIFTVLHLIYLGVIMDPSTDEVGIYKKWSQLYFISFWIMIINILVII